MLDICYYYFFTMNHIDDMKFVGVTVAFSASFLYVQRAYNGLTAVVVHFTS